MIANNSNTLRIIITGGTFDKEYNELNGQLYFRDTHVNEVLNKGRCRVPVSCTTLMMIDSLEMNDSDRSVICQHCIETPETRIIITHGTDTMVETAAVLAGYITGKVIVLTGAMIPYHFGSSDGLFNMGTAIAFVQVLSPGVYIAMNGQYFRWDEVYKNKARGEFALKD